MFETLSLSPPLSNSLCFRRKKSTSAELHLLVLQFVFRENALHVLLSEMFGQLFTRKLKNCSPQANTCA